VSAKKRKPSGRKRTTGRQWLPVPARRGLILVTIVALGVVLVALAMQRVRAYVSAGPRHRVHPDRVRVIEKPSWLSDADIEAMIRVADLREDFGYYDEGMAETFRAAWSRSGRVSSEGSVDVSLIHPNRVGLSIPIRRPVAAVHDFSDAEHPLVLVDRRCACWPVRFAVNDPDLARFGDSLPVIWGVGVAVKTPPAGSNAWGDERVRHGVAVAVDLRRGMDATLASRAKIRKIHVSHVDNREPHRSEIVLESEGGLMIEWGRSSASDLASGEVSVAKKIANLRLVFRSPDRGRGSVVKVQFDTVYFSRE
jgi:hypothetical protein